MLTQVAHQRQSQSHVISLAEGPRDSRQMRTFAPSMAMYKYTEQATI